MKTLYLGAKVEISMPYVPFYLRKLVALLVTTLLSISLFSQDFHFNGVLQDKRVLLNWLTVQDKNVSHFVIERSLDGTAYHEAAFVFIDNNSDQLSAYTYADALNIEDVSILYYRLRMVGLDGKESYSLVRMILSDSPVNNQPKISVCPNPVVDNLRITIPEGWQNRLVTYELYDAAGRLLKQVVNKSAAPTQLLDMRAQIPGNYIIKAYTSKLTVTDRVVKN